MLVGLFIILSELTGLQMIEILERRRLWTNTIFISFIPIRPLVRE